MRSFPRLRPLFALPLLVAATVHEEPAPEFSADAFRSHVATLADDHFEGRETGTPGFNRAANYVAAQFATLGILPGGERSSWFQTITFRSTQLGKQPAIITISGPRGRTSWENGTEILLGPSPLEAVQDIRAPVVFAGYGIHAPHQGIEDFRGLDVRGKIVAVLAGTPRGLPGELAAHLSDEKPMIAAARGAIGIITLPTGASERAASWQVRIRHAQGSRMVWLDADGKAQDEAPGIRFIARLNTAAADTLFAGARRSYGEVRAQAEGGQPKGFALRAKVRVQRSSLLRDLKSPNVIGLLPGGDPHLRGEYVVLSAHLDHLGIRPAEGPGTGSEDRIYNGALDNAAGVATMLEAARAFATAKKRPRRSILFIALTGEEKGLLGSEFFARHPVVPIDRIAAAVNLDMPLLLYEFSDVIAFGAEHSTLGRTVAQAARQLGLTLSPDPMPEQNIFVRSDHYNFVRKGVPAIMLATGYANGGQAQWQAYLNGNYHSVKDEVSQPINWQAGTRFAHLSYMVARSLADAPERPLWYQGDFFGQTYAPSAAKAADPVTAKASALDLHRSCP